MEKYGAGHGKNGEKRIDESFGGKKAAFVSPQIVLSFFFFFSLLLPSPGTIFLFLGLENLDRLECFTPRLLQSLASACRSDFHRATNNNKITTLFFLIKISCILFLYFSRIAWTIFKQPPFFFLKKSERQGILISIKKEISR